MKWNVVNQFLSKSSCLLNSLQSKSTCYIPPNHVFNTTPRTFNVVWKSVQPIRILLTIVIDVFQRLRFPPMFTAASQSHDLPESKLLQYIRGIGPAIKRVVHTSRRWGIIENICHFVLLIEQFHLIKYCLKRTNFGKECPAFCTIVWHHGARILCFVMNVASC